MGSKIVTPATERRRWRLALLIVLGLAQTGCQGFGNRLSWLFPSKYVPDVPEETMVLRDGQLESVKASEESEAARQLAGAHEIYRRGEFGTAGNLFHKIAENKKNSQRVVEEARYYEAESLRREGRYPKAADTYNKCLQDVAGGIHREQAVQHMFDIANYWLDDTRAEMVARREKKEGKRWFVWDPWIHFEKSKPLLDQEGRAIEKLEQVAYSGVNGQVADHSLYLLDSIHFYRENYRDADHYFSQLVERHPNSPYAAKAVELAIVAKHLSTGGADYDGRKVAEARELVHKALYTYPELARTKKDFLERQLEGITHQQAEKDFKKADFYDRTKHPGSAYFYYGIVVRRYPGSKFADKAEKRMAELLKKHKDKIAKTKPAVDALPEEGPTPRTAPEPGAVPEQGPTPRTVPEQGLTPFTPPSEQGPAPGVMPEESPRPRTLPKLPAEQMPANEAQEAPPPKKKSLLDRAIGWIRH